MREHYCVLQSVMLFVCCAHFAKIVKNTFRIPRWKIEVGDLVQIISGCDRGGVGKVTVVDHTRNSLKVEGKKTMEITDQSGKRVKVERFIHYSNVNLVDPITRVPTRIATETGPDGSMIRISKRSGAVIPLPDRLVVARDLSKIVDGDKDTIPEVALQKTFHSEHEVATMKNVRQRMKKYNYDLH